MKRENDFKELLLKLSNVDNATMFPLQEDEDADFYKREKYAKPILKKMKKLYNSDFSDMVIKDLYANLLNWKLFFLCNFIQAIKDEKTIKPLINILPKIDALDPIWNTIIDTLVSFGESAAVYLREEYNNRMQNNENIMDLLEMLIRIGGSQNKTFVINSYDALPSLEIELFADLLANTKDLDYLPTLQKLRKKFKRIQKLKNAIEESIYSLTFKEKTYDEDSLYWFQENNSVNLHKQAKKAEKNGELEKSYEIYDYLASTDFNNFKSLYGKARVGFKLKKYDYELARIALKQAIDNKASLVWINEIKLFKQKLKEKLIQMDDYDESDDYKWMIFKCKKCGKEQILRTGTIFMVISTNIDNNINYYEYETMCTQCKSRELELAKISEIDLIYDAIMTEREDPDIVKTAETIMFNDKEIKIHKLHKYINNQLKKGKKDALFYLRSGNALRKTNYWDEALRLYKLSQQIEPLFVANYYSLIRTNVFRYYDFGDKNAQKIALSYLEILKSIPPDDLDYTFMRYSFDLDEYISKMEFYLSKVPRIDSDR